MMFPSMTALQWLRRMILSGHLRSIGPSSAAICVLVARAFASVYGLALSPRDEMELAYAGERRTGSECGRMDQVCAYGRRVTCLRFDGDDFLALLDVNELSFLNRRRFLR